MKINSVQSKLLMAVLGITIGTLGLMAPAYADRVSSLATAFNRADPIENVTPSRSGDPHSARLLWKDGSTQLSRGVPGNPSMSHVTIYNGQQGNHYSFDHNQLNGTFSGGHWTHHRTGKTHGVD